MSFSNRRGFTLVELLVAVLLIDVALLAMVAGSAVVVRRQLEIRTRLAAAQTAANRIQLLTGATCRPLAGTIRTEQGIGEFWSADLIGSEVELRDSVAYHAGSVERSVVLRTRASC